MSPQSLRRPWPRYELNEFGSSRPPAANGLDDDAQPTATELERLVDEGFHGSRNKEERPGITDIYIVYPDHFDPQSPGICKPGFRLPFICWFLGEGVADDQAQMRALDLVHRSVFHERSDFLASSTPWPYYRGTCRKQGLLFRVGSLDLYGRRRLECIAERLRPKPEYICPDATIYLEWIRDTLWKAERERLFDSMGVERARGLAQQAANKPAGRLVKKYREEQRLSDQE
ncbi:uncharacterized protein PHACADRAFT_185359 [Phanerochaete carnosa HHB-10118-sp]|uniref:Uncharacterized protein n=1 Tax=Phanerochaete carnosa (strain HHB-10118-sp) TaxID=650164 RepID=K5WVH2_PHACS|nr:uncharacterized protein PHACADRAFT_185359 [Phanerochaete carnosa HHB-10118-sp]EKM54432.1 hypothetical protein PHACADRAFT_185359 [Phanerochaete carnosa HHB-10118-sp]